KDGRSDKAGVEKHAKSSGKAAPKPAKMEVRFLDDSTMKLTVSDPHIELQTPYGELVIPFADIHRIDLGTRVSEEDTKRAEALAPQLASPRFNDREEATAALQALSYRSFPVLLRFANSSDPEVARRAEQLLTKLREAVPADV